MRRIATYSLDHLDAWREQLLRWAYGFEVFMYLDSNGHKSPWLEKEWDILVAAGAADTLTLPSGEAFEALKAWQTQTGDWLFGGFGYDLKNEIEHLSSGHADGIGFPDLLFFQPEIVVGIRENFIEIQTLSSDPALVMEAIKSAPGLQHLPMGTLPEMKPRISRAEYLGKVAAIRQHIIEGDLYEMNLCQEFYDEETAIDPFAVWLRLNNIAKAPMSAFFRWHDRYLLSASPERFLKKEGAKLLSQPIKGTRRRSKTNDEMMRNALADSEKDRAENVMIVDLVRNDLSRSCRPGSVKAEELFGIYTFETVHQMISTISGELLSTIHPIDALKHTFPPGSMTGAPKVMAMDLIEVFENSRRGLYSGALGYFDPSGDFDFNVLIRTILFNATRQYVSFHVGGAIVFDSIPEDEYEECLVKAGALFSALGRD